MLVNVVRSRVSVGEMVSNMELMCSLCTNIQCVTFSDYLKHLQLFHVHQAHFRIMCTTVHYCKSNDTLDFAILPEMESSLENNVSDVKQRGD